MHSIPKPKEIGKLNIRCLPPIKYEMRYAEGMRTAHSIKRFIRVVYLTLPVPFTMQEIALNTAYIH